MTGRILVLSLCLFPATARAADPPPRVAFTHLATAGVRAEDQPGFRRALEGGLVAAGLVVLGPDRVAASLKDQPGLIGCETSVCLKTIGAKLRAIYTARAKVEDTGGSFAIEVTLTGAASGRQAAQVTRQCDACTLKEVQEAASRAAEEAGRTALRTVATEPALPPERRVEPPPHRVEPRRDPPPPVVVVPPRPSPLKPAGIALLVAGGVALVPGIALLAIDGKDTGKTRPGEHQVYSTLAGGAVGVGVGVAAAVTGAVLLYLGIKQQRRVKLGVAPTRGGAWVSGEVRF
jgi:hypothetical protein